MAAGEFALVRARVALAPPREVEPDELFPEQSVVPSAVDQRLELIDRRARAQRAEALPAAELPRPRIHLVA
ncbi:MAG: hypothetical protein E6J87_06515 [Deltaproteobacteria bacterium]|nr:MAG: hypothetical protein E6J87_06515 [Deltaproteobacteria bacterium]